MSDSLLEDFIRESEEYIIELNNTILALESDSSNKPALEEAFRITHTLKGNLDMMGFSEPSSLAHALEDVFDEIREDRLDATPAIIDRILAGVDTLEESIVEIDKYGKPESSIGPQIALIRSIVGSDSVDTEDYPRSPLDSTDINPLEEGSHRSNDDDTSVVIANIQLIENGPTDQSAVLEPLTEKFPFVKSVKLYDSDNEGGSSRNIVLWVESRTPLYVESALESMPAIGECSVRPLTDYSARGTEALMGNTGPSTRLRGAEPEDPTSTHVPSHSAGNIKSVRVDVKKLDQLHQEVEQLMAYRMQLRQSISEADMKEEAQRLDDLDAISTRIHQIAMNIRLIPVRKVANTLPRFVRDLTRSQNKEIRFSMDGTSIGLDRTILDAITDPLVQIIRNAVDHGIEPPDVREKHNKPRRGSIHLRVKRGRGEIVISVEDDGRGIDRDAIEQWAEKQEVKPPEQLSRMSEEDYFDLIFHPEFSTSEEVTDVSGRGVGMDIVRNTVGRHNGDISIDSTRGHGTTVRLHLPVSITSGQVLFIEVGDEILGIPMTVIDEIIGSSEKNSSENGQEIHHNGTVYPIVALHTAMNLDCQKSADSGKMIKIRAAGQQAVLRCDSIIHRDEVVIKQFEEKESRDIDILLGTAMAQDGTDVPIIDVARLNGWAT